MNLNSSIFFALITCTATAYAEAPFLDYQWKVSPDACLERAHEALATTGFRTTNSTGKSEVVGVKGDYKGIIACLGEESSIAVFIVGGPHYEQARKWAMKMKENF